MNTGIIEVGHIIEQIEEIGHWIKQSQQLSPEHDPMVDPVIDRLLTVTEGRFLFDILSPVSFSGDKLHFNDQEFMIGPMIFSQVKKSEKIVVFACTIGSNIDRLIRQYFLEGHYFEGYIADAVASYLVEQLANKLHLDIQQHMAKEGDRITNRFSPGYCNWNVDEQKKLFETFLIEDRPIKLTESSLMQPIKSISGIIGAGKKVEWKHYQCNSCQRKDCSFRGQGLPGIKKNPLGA